MDCKHCRGNGEAECMSCMGEGCDDGRKCSSCHGSGIAECKRCNGSGLMEEGGIVIAWNR
jgi:hypothetical protein